MKSIKSLEPKILNTLLEEYIDLFFQLIIDEPRIKFLIEKAISNEDFQKGLFALITASKQDETLVISAANALQIFNAAGVSFAHMD